MPASPFLTVHVQSKKDALRLRRQARQVAHLLRFDVHAQACIAAAVFFLAIQTLARQGVVEVSFRLDRKHLHVDAAFRTNYTTVDTSTALHLHEDASGAQYRLVRALPPETELHEREVANLVKLLGSALSDNWFEEIIKQNEEILALSSGLLKLQAALREKEEKASNPSAA